MEYDLNRFCEALDFAYELALGEMRAGRKRSHWIWYVFPQVKGLGRSYNARYYALDGVEEARQFLNDEELGGRLREITEVVLEHRLSRRVSLSTSVSYTNANGEYDFRYRRLNLDGTVAYDTTATRKNSDIEAFRAEVSTFGYLDKGQWCGKVYYYDSERGIPGAIVNNVFKNGERQWDKNLFAQGSFEYSFSPRYQMKGSAKWAWDYMRFLRDDPKELYINNNYY